MIKRRTGESAPTDQDVTAAFKKIQKIIPADQVATITQARDGIGNLLGFCLALFDAWGKLDLAVSMDTHQKELATSIATLREAKEDLEKSLETAKFDHLQALLSLSDELVAKKTTTENEKTILDTEILDLQNKQIGLEKGLAEQKRVFETETAAELQTKNDELARLDEEIVVAETQLAKTQKAMAVLKAKLG